MSLRDKLNEHPLAAGGAVAAVIVISLIFAYFSTSSSSPQSRTLPVFLSTDDGATWFQGKAGELPPIKQPDGKMAVQVHLFKCGDGQPFVGYMEKYTDEAKAILDSAKESKGPVDLLKLQTAATRGLLVKRRSDKDWSPGNNTAVKDVTCPDKTKATQVMR